MADNNELQEVMDEAGLRHLWAGLKERLALKNHTHSAADVGAAAASDLTSHTDNKNNPHGVTAAQAGAVPTSRTVNSKALSANITLSAGDVGAVAKNEDVVIQKSGAAYDSIFGQGTRNALLRVRNVAGNANNQRTLALFDSTQRPDLETALRLYDVVDGTETIYSIFGEHNLDKLATSLGAAKIATGSYTGTNTYGSGNKNTLTFDFVPALVAIVPTDETLYRGFLLPVGTVGFYMYSSGQGNLSNVSVSGKTVSWYGDRADRQLNKTGTYRYIAIG